MFSLHLRPILFFLFTFTLLSLSGLLHAQETIRRIAIFPFALESISQDEYEQVWKELTRLLEDTKRFRVMSQAAMDAVMVDVGFNKLDECTNPACAAYFGKLLGVEGVLLGNLRKVGSHYYGAFRLVHVEKAQLIWEREFVHDGPLKTLFAGGASPLGKDLAAMSLEPKRKTNWLAIGAAVVGGGLLLYFTAKSLGLIKSDVQFQGEEPKPPPSDGN